MSPGAAMVGAVFPIARSGRPGPGSGLKICSVPRAGVPDKCNELPTFRWAPAASRARTSTHPGALFAKFTVKESPQVPLVKGAERVGPAVITTLLEGVKPVRF